MYTYHHGFWLYFFSRNHPLVWHFVIGSMLPDYIYIVLLGVLLVTGSVSLTDLPSLSPATFMTYLPQHEWAVRIDLAGHSVIFWGIAFILSLLPLFSKAQALIIGWGTHLILDTLTHAAYSNFFFYPLSMMTVHSPVSYWEPEYFAREFRLVNGALLGAALAYLVYRWCKTRRKEEK